MEYEPAMDWPRGLCIAVAVVLPIHGYAITWEVEPGVSAIASYVDNVNLANSGEQSSTVYRLNPAIRIRGEGPRTIVELNYGLQFVHYANFDDSDETYQQGDASLNWSTKNDVFSIEANAGRGQEARTLDATVPPNLETISENRATTTRYSVTPRFQYRFDGTAQLLLEARWDRIEYDGGNIVDDEAEDRGYTAALSSGTNFQRVSWGLNFTRQEFNTDEVNRDDHTTRRSGTLGYLINRRLRFSASGGTEEVVSQGVEVFEDDGYWETGLEWSPTSRTRVRASAGERAFGDTQAIEISRSGRRSNFDASYTEEVTSQSYRRAFDLTIRDGSDGIQDITLIGILDEIFISKRADIRLTLKGRYNTVSVSAFGEQREFLTAGTEEDYKGLGVSWALQLGRRTTLDFDLSYAKRESIDTNREDELTQLVLGLRRQFAQNVTIAGGYEHNRQQSNTDNDYQQNILRASITASF